MLAIGPFFIWNIKVNAKIADGIITSFIPLIMRLAILIPYFLRSKRINATFRHRIRRRDLHLLVPLPTDVAPREHGGTAARNPQLALPAE